MTIFFLILLPHLVIGNSNTFSDSRNWHLSVECAIQRFEFIYPTGLRASVYPATVIFGMAFFIALLLGEYKERLEDIYEADWLLSAGLAILKVVTGSSRSIGKKTRFYHDLLKRVEARRKLILALKLLERRCMRHRLWFIMVEEVGRSFALQLVWLLFYFSFGTGQLLAVLTNQRDTVSFDFTFGQLMPLLLFMLPILAGLEIFAGEYDR